MPAAEGAPENNMINSVLFLYSSSRGCGGTAEVHGGEDEHYGSGCFREKEAQAGPLRYSFPYFVETKRDSSDFIN